MGNPNAPIEDRFATFVAGDDSNAKATVSKLIEDIGFAPVDTGSKGRWSQAATGVSHL